MAVAVQYIHCPSEGLYANSRVYGLYVYTLTPRVQRAKIQSFDDFCMFGIVPMVWGMYLILVVWGVWGVCGWG